jgi:hypothetical protein
LHYHPIEARLLHDRLRHAEFVDAIAQGRNILLQREVLDSFPHFGLQGNRDRKLLAGVVSREQQIRILALDFYCSLVARSASRTRPAGLAFPQIPL